MHLSEVYLLLRQMNLNDFRSLNMLTGNELLTPSTVKQFLIDNDSAILRVYLCYVECLQLLHE